VAQKIQSAMGCKPRVAMECTGFESSIATAIFVSLTSLSGLLCLRPHRRTFISQSDCLFQSVKFGGKVFVIGVGKDKQTLPFMHMSENEIDLQFQ
jgi:L-iditol 2-dehydrogenase